MIDLCLQFYILLKKYIYIIHNNSSSQLRAFKERGLISLITRQVHPKANSQWQSALLDANFEEL